MAMGTCRPAPRRQWQRFGVAVAMVIFACQGRAGAGGLGESVAKGGDKGAKMEAKARFVSGQSHYNLNEFTEALVDFKEAYRLLPDPVFLYNLGQCERQLGHLEEAVRFYRSFLREQPKAPNRQEVAHKIEEMEATLEAKQAEVDEGPPPVAEVGQQPTVGPIAATSAEPPSPPSSTAPPPPLPTAAPPAAAEIPESGVARIDLTTVPREPVANPSPAFYTHWWFWTAAGVVVAGAGVGIYAATTSRATAVPGSTLGSKRVF